MKIVAGIFTDATWLLPDAAVERIRGELPHVQVAHAKSAQEVSREIPDADVVLATRLTRDQVALARRLRWIHSAAAGVGGLLAAGLRESPIVVTNSRGIHGNTMAEHVIGVTIALMRDFPAAIRRQAGHRWHLNRIGDVRTIRGRHMVVVGLGGVGAATARLASLMGMRVTGVRRRPDASSPEGVDCVVGAGQLEEMLPLADVLVLAAPLTERTRALIGASQLRQMKRDALLVNVARGKLVNEAELAAELARGTIAAAALDVFEHEPLDEGSPLWDLPNVLITPHTSGLREDYWDAVLDIFIDNVRRFERGEPLVNVVDKAAGY